MSLTRTRPRLLLILEWITIRITSMRLRACILAPIAMVLAACGSGSKTDQTEIALVSIAYVQRAASAAATGSQVTRYAPGGDIFVVDSGNTQLATNLTASLTGDSGDISGLDISLDATRLLFSMKRTEGESWNLWELDLSSGAARAILLDNEGDDLEAKYLYDGRIVFTSTRQQQLNSVLSRTGIEPFEVSEEYGTATALSLHVINADGSGLQQISFSPSHERQPTPLNNGRILFSRWDHMGPKNRHNLYSINPDGTDMRLEYGAFSNGNSRSFPTQLANGKLLATVQKAGQSGGAAFIIDSANFSEEFKPDPTIFSEAEIASGTLTGQTQASIRDISINDIPSGSGRYRHSFPLMDGSNRILASFSLTSLVENTDAITGAASAATQETPNKFFITMLNLDTGTNQPVALAGAQQVLSSPVAILPRTVNLQTYTPTSEADSSNAPSPLPLATQQVGAIHVWSTYDTDNGNLARFSNAQLNATDPTIPIISATDSDTRTDIADLTTLKTLLPEARAARYVRLIKAVPTPKGFPRTLIGKTPYEMRQILGYGTVEPDGSFAFKVPADMPFTLQVLDAQGRSITPNYGWLQVRPGEQLSCKGCHSPRRGDSINTAAIRAQTSSSNNPETQAESRSRLENGSAEDLGLTLSSDIEFWDFWREDSLAAAITNGNFSSITYDNTSASFGDNASDAVRILNRLKSGIVSYAEHVQPVWDAFRGTIDPTTGKGTETCSGCHSTSNSGGAAANLDLSAQLESNSRLRSYEQLLAGGTRYDSENYPLIESGDRFYAIQNTKNLVYPGSSRRSVLTEVLYGVELDATNADETLASTRGDANAFNHAGLLTDSDLRIINEWIDLGAQYTNTPYVADAELDIESGHALSNNEVAGPDLNFDRAEFNTDIYPFLLASCASCHRPIGSNPNTSDGADNTLSTDPSGVELELSAKHNFVLSGDPDADFYSVKSMVNSLTPLDNNPLLLIPSYAGGESNLIHPLRRDAANNIQPFLPRSSSAYAAIRSWIQGGAR